MAEAAFIRDPQPTRASGVAAAAAPVTLQLPPPLPPSLPSSLPAEAAGVPVTEVPPLVEPAIVDFENDLPEIRLPATSRRPVRRRFLPPVAAPVAAPLADGQRPSDDGRQHLPLASPEAAAPPEDRRHHESSAAASAAPRRGRRLVLVGGGVAAALAIAAGLEIGVGFPALLRLPGALLLRLVPHAAATAPPADPAQRAAYYTERAAAGDSEAQVALAILYAKGEGVAQDYAAAATWFRRAAENGVVRAQYDLGVLYERGRGVRADYAAAVAWYRKAAEHNHPLAQYNLAVAYTKGDGVRRDPFEAAVWYHRAAAHGVVAAMVNLAILYERGEGIEASKPDAYAWYRAAARRGNAAAARRADQLLQAFSPWEQTRAEAKTADIAASIDDDAGRRAPRLPGPMAAAPRRPPAETSEPPIEPTGTLKSGLVGGRAASSPATGNP
ncbi:MAG: tetratricopeptide repeat protein [Thiohalocapsa sp.]